MIIEDNKCRKLANAKIHKIRPARVCMDTRSGKILIACFDMQLHEAFTVLKGKGVNVSAVMPEGVAEAAGSAALRLSQVHAEEKSSPAQEVLQLALEALEEAFDAGTKVDVEVRSPATSSL
jgi:hypothetical protein